MESLDSILKGNPEPTNIVERPEPKAEPEVKAETPKPEETPEQKAERERDEKGRFKAKEQDAQTPAKPDAQKAPEQPKVEKPAPTAGEKAKPATTPEAEQTLDPRHRAAIAQANDERRKRQELERRLAALEQPKAPDLATDPAGFQQHLNSTLQAREIDMRVNLSAAWAKRQYPDFDSVMEKWDGLLAENPHLYQQAIQQDLPADWAYQEVKRRELLSEIGSDPNAWREQQRAALRAELEAELASRAQPAPQRPSAPIPPPSLANAPSSAGGVSTKTTQWEGPTPFQKALNRR